MQTSDFIETVGGTFRVIDYWARNGVFGEAKRSPGSGRPRDWDERDALVARVLLDVNDVLHSMCGESNGITVEMARRIARKVYRGAEGVSLTRGCAKLHFDVRVARETLS